MKSLDSVINALRRIFTSLANPAQSVSREQLERLVAALNSKSQLVLFNW
jgi:hypothetical protein